MARKGKTRSSGRRTKTRSSRSRSRTRSSRRRTKTKKLYRSASNKIIAGVCGGIGDYLDVDATIIRLFWLLSFFVGGVGFLAYLIAWLIMPKNPRQRW
jgi:phage shock protein PspC (stress-responsive transcriptional regulator)